MPSAAGRATFASLSEQEQLTIREAQRAKKARAQLRRQEKQLAAMEALADGDGTLDSDVPTRCVVTSEEYFGKCPSGLFRDPNLPPTEEAIELLMSVLEAGDEQADRLSECQYFQFCGPERAVWDPVFNARLAWEGFFTITTRRAGKVEPLPELQPYYGVLHWGHFEASKHVRKALARMAREQRGYALSNCADPERTWQRIDEYHRQQHSTNWLTRRYFEMMRAASDDPRVNFALHTVELTEAPRAAAGEGDEGGEGGPPDGPPPEPPAELAAGTRVRFQGLVAKAALNGTVATAVEFVEGAGRWVARCADGECVRVKAANLCVLPAPPEPLAGEIGFSIGGVYTSLSGCGCPEPEASWGPSAPRPSAPACLLALTVPSSLLSRAGTGERSRHATGTCQLVLLGRWLQRRGYAFWSLGHCYSPEMDYKRQLGHRIYTRKQFRALLGQHRCPFRMDEASGGEASGEPRAPEPEDALAGLGGAARGGGAPFRPLRAGEVCEEAELLRAPPDH